MNDSETIRQIAELQQEYKTIEQDLEQVKDERNSLAMSLDFSDGAVKGCGITITKQVRVTITSDMKEVDPELYTRYIMLKADLMGIEAELKDAGLTLGMGLKMSESIRITGTPEV